MQLYKLLVSILFLSIHTLTAINKLSPFSAQDTKEHITRAVQSATQARVDELFGLQTHQPHPALAAIINPRVNAALIQSQNTLLAGSISNAHARQPLRMPSAVYGIVIGSTTTSLLLSGGIALSHKITPKKEAAIFFSLLSPLLIAISALFCKNQPCIDVPYWQAFTIASLSLMGLNAMLWRHAYLMQFKKV